MTAIHWESRVIWGRMPPRAVQLWNIYAAMVNNEGVAWPSLTRLTELMGAKKRDVASSARQWLIAHEALEAIADYVPPSKRGTPGANAPAYDAPIYARLTGRVVLDGQTYHLAYFPGHQAGMEDMKPPQRSRTRSPNSDRPSHQMVTSSQSPNSDPTQLPNRDPNVVPSRAVPNSTDSAAAPRARVREPGQSEGQGNRSAQFHALPQNAKPSELHQVYAAWESTGALMSALIAEELADAVREFGNSFVLAAIEEMGRSGARNLKYLRTMMDRCRAEGRLPGAPRPSRRPPAAHQAAKRAAMEDPDNWAGKASNLPPPSPVRPFRPKQEKEDPL